MQRFVRVFLLSSVALSLAACSGSEATVSETADAPIDATAASVEAVTEQAQSSIAQATDTPVAGATAEGSPVQQVPRPINAVRPQGGSASASVSSVTTAGVAASAHTSTVAVPTIATTGLVTLMIQPDRTEAQPGDVVRIGVAVQNGTSDELTDALISVNVPTGLAGIVDTGGAKVWGDSLEWTISVSPGRTRTLSFAVKTSHAARHKMLMSFPVTMRGGNLGNVVNGTAYYRVIELLPQTGVSLRTLVAVAGAVALALMAAGCTAGVAVARRVLSHQ